MAHTNKPIVAITSGDPNGVGYEIIIKGLQDPHILELCTPVVYGNPAHLKAHMQLLDKELHSLSFQPIRQIDEVREGRLHILSAYPDSTPLAIGTCTQEAGQASFLSLRRATDDLRAGRVHALVTAPINKENIQSEEFHFPGHTEFLTQQFGDGKESLMMMVSDQMKVALVTNHVPLAKITHYISEERILRKLHTLQDALVQDFQVHGPRIAVLALNPHAGDNGLLGQEEKSIITPAIERANKEGILAFGPYSADGFFGSGKYAHFDAILGMYHDQGLIPFKSLDMDGVNYTAGLNIVRTSPDHGTAYDRAGKNMASAASFTNALYMALDVLRRRATHELLTKDPLKIREIEDRPPRPLPNKGLDFLQPKAEA